METTVCQGEETWPRNDDFFISWIILKAAIRVPVLPTPALQCTNTGGGAASDLKYSRVATPDSKINMSSAYFILLNEEGEEGLVRFSMS